MEDYTAETNLTSQIKANEIIKKKKPSRNNRNLFITMHPLSI